MSMHDRFIPGKWLDDIDVNDFLNLNKKPFLKEPLFLENSSRKTEALWRKIKEAQAFEKDAVRPAFSSLKEAKAEYFDKESETVFGSQSASFEKKIGYSESLEDVLSFYRFTESPSRKEVRKTAFQLFDEIATAEMKKMIKMGLFKHAPVSFTPSYLHPDARRIALYGTKKLAEDKKWYFKSMEKHLQTSEWMQKRITVNREIQSLKEFEEFCGLYGFDPSKPAESAKDAVQATYLAILACAVENPSVPFSLSQTLPFLDAYIEQDLQDGKIKEDFAQELIDQLYLKLSAIRFAVSPDLAKRLGANSALFGETIGGAFVTKTTYRFLHSMRKFGRFPFSLRVVWDRAIPRPFRLFCERLMKEGTPLTFLNPRSFRGKEASVALPFGQFAVPGQEASLAAGTCDLEKALYLALNGGKDVATNANLAPLTQPSRKNEIDYEEAWAKFKDYLSYILSSYVEMANSVLYLNEVHNAYPLRSALLSSLLFYKAQFGFFNLEKVALILHGLEKKKCKIQRGEKGWIEKIEAERSAKEEIEIVVANVVAFIESEIAKIPLYKNGKASLRFDRADGGRIDAPEDLRRIWTIPPEVANAVFHASIQASAGDNLLDIIEEAFERDISRIDLSAEIKENPAE